MKFMLGSFLFHVLLLLNFLCIASESQFWKYNGEFRSQTPHKFSLISFCCVVNDKDNFLVYCDQIRCEEVSDLSAAGILREKLFLEEIPSFKYSNINCYFKIENPKWWATKNNIQMKIKKIIIFYQICVVIWK